MYLLALILTALTVGAAAQRPVTQLAVPGAHPPSLSNSDEESSLHDYLSQHPGGHVDVPPRVLLNGNASSSGPTQVDVGLAVVSLHEIDVLSGIVDMAVWQRL